MTTTYDTKRFSEAHARFLNDPRALTEDDLAQLAVVDPELSGRARRARSGFTETKAEDRQPLTVGEFATWYRDGLDPTLATHAHRIHEVLDRCEALEARVKELEARPAARFPYRGVWKVTETYPAGSLATWDGSVWAALKDNTGRRPPGPEWQLCVKRGADGKNAKDAE